MNERERKSARREEEKKGQSRYQEPPASEDRDESADAELAGDPTTDYEPDRTEDEDD